MKKTTVGLLTLAATAAFAGTAEAQIPLPNFTPFSVEVRGGVALPQGDFKGEDPETEMEYALNAEATYHFMPMLGVYGGYSYNRFGLEDAEDVSGTDRGASVGLRFDVPTPLLPIDPYVKGGAVYRQFEAELDGVDGSIESDWGWGWQVGGGVGLPLGPKISFTPGVTYTKWSADVTDDLVEDEFDVEHVTVDVGLRIRI